MRPYPCHIRGRPPLCKAPRDLSAAGLSRERIIFIGGVPNGRTRAVYHQRPLVRVAVPGYTGQRRLPSRRNRRIYVIAPWSQQLCGSCPLALIDNAFYPVLIHRLAVSLHASSPRSVTLT